MWRKPSRPGFSLTFDPRFVDAVVVVCDANGADVGSGEDHGSVATILVKP